MYIDLNSLDNSNGVQLISDKQHIHDLRHSNALLRSNVAMLNKFIIKAATRYPDLIPEMEELQTELRQLKAGK